jgi:hypothetical protein
MSDMKSWALYYRAMGMSVFPVQAKLPLVPWKKYQEELPSEDTIKEWWSNWPSASIGCATGQITQRLILDIDGDEGRTSIGQFNIPLTQTVATRRGFQYHFQLPRFDGRTTLAGVLPGVDVRGNGGLCILPPSEFSTKEGRYEWVQGLDTPLAECPQWLLDLLIEKNKPRQIDRESGESWLKEKLDAIAPGNRNATFTSIAGSLRSRGYSSGDIFELLSGKAGELDFELNELRTICASVGSYAPREQVNTEAQSVVENAAQFLTNIEKVEWISPQVLSKQSIALIVGLEETCKTWAMMDMAIEAAVGGYWLGRFKFQKSKVLYIDQEQIKAETQRRFLALLKGKGLSAADVQDTLLIKANSTIRIDLDRSLESFKKILADFKPDIVLVDSFKAFQTKDTGSNVEMQAVMERLKELRAEYGCSFVFIFHENKGAYIRKDEGKQASTQYVSGAKVMSEVPEVIYLVDKKSEMNSVINQVKNRMSQKIESVEINVVDLKEDKSEIAVKAY